MAISILMNIGDDAPQNIDPSQRVYTCYNYYGVSTVTSSFEYLNSNGLFPAFYKLYPKDANNKFIHIHCCMHKCKGEIKDLACSRV